MMEKEKLMKVVGARNLYYERAVLNEYSRGMSFVNTIKPLCEDTI
jgi:hypothetical protein